MHFNCYMSCSFCPLRSQLISKHRFSFNVWNAFAVALALAVLVLLKLLLIFYLFSLLYVRFHSILDWIILLKRNSITYFTSIQFFQMLRMIAFFVIHINIIGCCFTLYAFSAFIAKFATKCQICPSYKQFIFFGCKKVFFWFLFLHFTRLMVLYGRFRDFDIFDVLSARTH